MLLTLLYL